MSADYGSPTVNYIASKGNGIAVQDMIGIPSASATPNNNQMRNGMVGSKQGMAAVTPASAAAQIAADQTPAIAGNNATLRWTLSTGLWA